MLPLWTFLTVSAVLFSIGTFGVLSRRNGVAVLMGVELMLNAVNINIVAFWRYTASTEINGMAFAAFVFVIAAAEAAVGLAIIITLYRNRHSVTPEEASLLKG